MGCFLGCFGLKKKKRKNRKPRNICSSSRQSLGSYVPLDNEISVSENRVSSDFLSNREKRKDSMKSKIKKKVTFNLNVRAYEPIVQEEEEDDVCSYLSEGEERTKWEFNSETISKSIQSFPANYRYQNCRDNCDFEDEELDWDEDEFYSDEIDEDDEDVKNGYYSDGSYEEFSWKSNPMYADQRIEERKTEQVGDLLKTSSSHNVRSVLNPVENLSQWKEIKAKAAVQFKRDKENIMLEQQQEPKSSNAKQSDSLAFRNVRNSSAVDASLSNWIGSMETQQRYKSH